MSTVIICAPAMVETRRWPAGDRWCFGCRKRLPHEDVLLECQQTLDFLAGRAAEPSYWDPVVVRRCSRCGKDRTRFPGGGL